MSAGASLSDLCTICYTEKPKYRCPRCKTQTCSLPCYKRHQQRASCSGERDPAAYMKKNQLATPSGLDQDYNYLKKIERTIDRANQDSRDQQGKKNLASTRNAARGWQPDSSLQKYLVENRILVERAPKGMSRQQTNNTRPTKSKRIMWTVEWIDSAGYREIQHDCLESESPSSLHRLHQVEKRNAAKKQAAVKAGAETFQRPQKRKRGQTQPQQVDQSSTEASAPDAVEITDDIIGSTQSNGKAETDDIVQPPGPSNTEATMVDPDATPDTQQFFYLLRPATAASSQILIPLDASMSLTMCLRDRTVQEYPTIFVLTHSPALLPKGYMLEEDYMRARCSEEAELKALETQHSHLSGVDSAQSGAQEETLDAKGILDMLKRDVRRQ